MSAGPRNKKDLGLPNPDIACNTERGCDQLRLHNLALSTPAPRLHRKEARDGPRLGTFDQDYISRGQTPAQATSLGGPRLVTAQILQNPGINECSVNHD